MLACKKLMAYIPDNPDLYEHLSGFQYINFIADLYEVPSQKRQDLIQKYGDLFDMTNHLSGVISSYSLGMKQRVAIISALVHSPKLLVLDEPFAGLDPKAAFLLKDIMQAQQITAIYPRAKIFMENAFLSLKAGLGFFIVLSMAVYYLFVKGLSLKYEWLYSLSKIRPKYANHQKLVKAGVPLWPLPLSCR